MTPNTTKNIISLTADDYDRLINDYDLQKKYKKEGVTIRVVQHFIIVNADKLPDLPTVFMCDLLGQGCKIKSFNCKVKGNCKLSASKLEEIGPDAEFGGELKCCGTKIKRFNNKVLGNCSFKESTLEEIGPDAVFGGALDCQRTKIKRFNHKVRGWCTFAESALEELGPNAEFCNYLICRDTKLKTFDNRVAGFCIFQGSPIEYIGPNAVFGENLHLYGTPIRRSKLVCEGAIFTDKNFRLLPGSEVAEWKTGWREGIEKVDLEEYFKVPVRSHKECRGIDI